MKKVTTTVTYRVSEGAYCNLNDKAPNKCRFCVKERQGYICALHNMPLDVELGSLVKKTRQCVKNMARFSTHVEDEIQINPAMIMKATIAEYDKLRKSLLAQGYPAAIAEKVAREGVCK